MELTTKLYLEGVDILVALKLLLLASVFNLSQISTEDSIVREDDSPGTDMVARSETGDDNDSAWKDSHNNNEAGYDELLLKEKWEAPRNARYFSGFYRERYIASIKINCLLRSHHPGENPTERNGLILIGIKKPYYRLDRNPRVNGRVDLQMSGSIFGIENEGLLSFSYDFKGKNIYRRISTSVSFDSFLYRITIPFWVK